MSERNRRAEPGFWARQIRWLLMLLAALAGFLVSMGVSFWGVQYMLSYEQQTIPPDADSRAHGETLCALANDLVDLAQQYRDHVPQGTHRLRPQTARWFAQDFVPRVNHYKLRLSEGFDVLALPAKPLRALRLGAQALQAAANAPAAPERGRTALRAVEDAVVSVSHWIREAGVARYLRTPLRHL
ncbi:MAG: hypothetical protein ACLFTT_00495 [Candidatus Hydrogenedentota bacterium]